MMGPRTTWSTAATRYLTGFCFISIFAFGLAASASAEVLLFLPLSGKFPYHLTGLGVKSVLETVGGTQVKAEKIDALALILSKTLFDLHLEFLKSTTELGGTCTNTGGAETILMNLIGHFGYADPGENPAVLLLVPSGFKFTCTVLGIPQQILLRGSVIGVIPSADFEEETEELILLFSQSKGKQEYTTFLLGATTLPNQFEEASTNEGAFEQSGQQTEPIELKALPGEGKFELQPALWPVRATPASLKFKELKVGEEEELTVTFQWKRPGGGGNSRALETAINNITEVEIYSLPSDTCKGVTLKPPPPVGADECKIKVKFKPKKANAKIDGKLELKGNPRGLGNFRELSVLLEGSAK